MVSHYSRLFGGPFAGHDETHLREVSMRMKDIPQNRRGRPRRGDLAPSGFVYLGQFLDHDLTHDETSLEHASAAPEKTRNFHAPRLNLESVYGNGPQKSPGLYDHSERGSEIFFWATPGRCLANSRFFAKARNLLRLSVSLFWGQLLGLTVLRRSWTFNFSFPRIAWKRMSFEMASKRGSRESER